jgi:hypothetical protein
MSEGRNAFGFAGFALLPLCCLGVPLLIAAGISAAALALIAGITVAAIACAAAIALLIARRPQTKAPWRRPSPSVRGGAHGSAE